MAAYLDRKPFGGSGGRYFSRSRAAVPGSKRSKPAAPGRFERVNDQLAHPPGTNSGWRSARSGRDRKVDHGGAADEAIERNRAETSHAAVARVVAIVAHHEELPGWHLVNPGVVIKAGVDAIEHLLADAVGQGFPPALHRVGGIFPA